MRSNEDPSASSYTDKVYKMLDDLVACGTSDTQSTDYDEHNDSSNHLEGAISLNMQIDNEDDDKGNIDVYSVGKMNMIGNNSILNKDSIVPCSKIESVNQEPTRKKLLLLMLLLVCAIITITVVIFGIMSSKYKNGNTTNVSIVVSDTTPTNNNTSGYNVSIIPPNFSNNTPSTSPNVMNYSTNMTSSESNHNTTFEDDVVVHSIYINAGGEAYYDNSTNQSWLADVYYNGGRTVDIESCQVENVTTTFAACSYRLFRQSAGGNFSYDIPIPNIIIENDTEYYTSSANSTTNNVKCNVSMYFMEDYYTQSGMRIFDVIIEDKLIMLQLDVYDVSGGTSKLYKSNPMPIIVNDSVISIEFVPIVSYPVISGIEINCTYYSIIKPDSNNNQATSELNHQLFFHPGYLSVQEHGLLLSQGLTAKIIAVAGKPVQYHDGTMSSEIFHEDLDAGATYIDPSENNVGGWIYVSNSEVRPNGNGGKRNMGGVGAITFDSNGNVIQYQNILNGTTANCGGGKTPWNSWISCEEYTLGEIYQVDPMGIRPSEKITMGSVNPGQFESFAYDVRNQTTPHFFVTKDYRHGELTRFTPVNINWSDPWSKLQGPGIVEYLAIDSISENHGTYSWTTKLSLARSSASKHFPNCEGIDVYENELYFISKIQNTMYILDLDSNNYTRYSTHEGLFAGQPDQIVRLTGNTTSVNDEGLLYFTEDGGSVAGVHARNRYGQYYTILESREYDDDETTGLSFSPNHLHLYIAYQDNGILFDVTRIDGLPFSANTLNVKYHKTT